ncbi:hypothetical protein [Mesorhizobium sp.]|uniref:hypothetical protein n=1 Tax=Mesorhizobium sp. TaxID=1871066 RepID=UPI003BA987E4
MGFKRIRSFDTPMTAACSCLVGLLLFALLCLGQPGAPRFSGAGSDGPSLSLERSGEAAALLRVAGKVQALEVRSGRPVFAKFAGGNPALLSPAPDFLLLDRTSLVDRLVVPAVSTVPRSNANRPRAPPSV